MYSGHNFYFKPYIALFALLPVIDCKGLEAARFIKQKPSIWHCPHHPLAYVASTTTTTRHCQVDLILIFGICERAPLWTIVDHPISQQQPRAWALNTWKEITYFVIWECVAVVSSSPVSTKACVVLTLSQLSRLRWRCQYFVLRSMMGCLWEEEGILHLERESAVLDTVCAGSVVFEG